MDGQMAHANIFIESSFILDADRIETIFQVKTFSEKETS